MERESRREVERGGCRWKEERDIRREVGRCGGRWMEVEIVNSDYVYEG